MLSLFWREDHFGGKGSINYFGGKIQFLAGRSIFWREDIGSTVALLVAGWWLVASCTKLEPILLLIPFIDH